MKFHRITLFLLLHEGRERERERKSERMRFFGIRIKAASNFCNLTTVWIQFTRRHHLFRILLEIMKKETNENGTQEGYSDVF